MAIRIDHKKLSTQSTADQQVTTWEHLNTRGYAMNATEDNLSL